MLCGALRRSWTRLGGQTRRVSRVVAQNSPAGRQSCAARRGPGTGRRLLSRYCWRGLGKTAASAATTTAATTAAAVAPALYLNQRAGRRAVAAEGGSWDRNRTGTGTGRRTTGFQQMPNHRTKIADWPAGEQVPKNLQLRRACKWVYVGQRIYGIRWCPQSRLYVCLYVCLCI